MLYSFVGRTTFDCSKDVRLQVIINAAEQWADSGRAPSGVSNLCQFPEQPIYGVHNEEWDRQNVATQCLRSKPDLVAFQLDGSRRHQLANAYRELVPNPFLPLTWKPEWFTSMVRAIATTMYDTRDFSTMPIMADALQDAGCEEEQVLTHCRANKPHARGCWVVDAILGKT